MCSECGDLCPECNVCSKCEEACPECNVCHACKADYCPNCGKCEDCIEFIYECLDDHEHSVKCDCGEDLHSEDHVFGERSIWDPDRKWTCTVCGYVCPLNKRTTQKPKTANSLSSLDVRTVTSASNDILYQNAEYVQINRANGFDVGSNVTIESCDGESYSNAKAVAKAVLSSDVLFDKIDIFGINDNRQKVYSKYKLFF